MKPALVLYHGPHCADGFAAALVAWEYFGGGAQAHFVPVNYGDPVPAVPEGVSTIYVLDFSFPREVLLDWCRQHQVVVLDHHKTAEEELGKLRGVDGLFVRFDREKSGCVMAWEYFREVPDSPIFGEVPELLLYVQDRDLWEWLLPYSEEVSAGLTIRPREFAEWARLLDTGLGGREAIAELKVEGETVLRCRRQLVESIVANAREIAIGALTVPAVSTPVLVDEVCERMLELNPGFAMVASFRDVVSTQGGLRRWSLRSRPGFDCSVVAKAFNGGGHAQAAGFEQHFTVVHPTWTTPASPHALTCDVFFGKGCSCPVRTAEGSAPPGAGETLVMGARAAQGKTRIQALSQELVKRSELQKAGEEIRE